MTTCNSNELCRQSFSTLKLCGCFDLRPFILSPPKDNSQHTPHMQNLATVFTSSIIGETTPITNDYASSGYTIVGNHNTFYIYSLYITKHNAIVYRGYPTIKFTHAFHSTDSFILHCNHMMSVAT